MSDIVLSITKAGYSEDQIMTGLGMDMEEFKRLCMVGGVAANEIKDVSAWSQAWVPAWDGK